MPPGGLTPVSRAFPCRYGPRRAAAAHRFGGVH